MLPALNSFAPENRQKGLFLPFPLSYLLLIDHVLDLSGNTVIVSFPQSTKTVTNMLWCASALLDNNDSLNSGAPVCAHPVVGKLWPSIVERSQSRTKGRTGSIVVALAFAEQAQTCKKQVLQRMAIVSWRRGTP